MLEHQGLVLDNGWKGLAETEVAWNIVSRVSWSLEMCVAVLLVVSIGLESVGRFKLADRCVCWLFALDVIANIVPTLVNFEHTLHVAQILEQMDCAPGINVLFNAMVTGAFGQATQFLVGIRLGPIILATSVAILRAAHLVAVSADDAEPAERVHLTRGAVWTFRFAPVISILISAPIFLMISAYSDDTPMKASLPPFQPRGPR